MNNVQVPIDHHGFQLGGGGGVKELNKYIVTFKKVPNCEVTYIYFAK